MADSFSLDVLIRSIKDLRKMELARHLREAMKTQDVGMDAGIISDLVEELENDIEEHITRLERISAVLTPQERQRPEEMSHIRQQEVAWQSKCDLEEVSSLCEAFSRAREIMESMGSGERKNVDLKILFTNLGGMMGLDANAVKESGGGVQFSPEFLQKLLEKGLAAHRAEAAKKPAAASTEGNDLASFEAQFDFGRQALPRNRLPKDWRSK